MEDRLQMEWHVCVGVTSRRIQVKQVTGTGERLHFHLAWIKEEYAGPIFKRGDIWVGPPEFSHEDIQIIGSLIEQELAKGGT